MTSPDNKQSLSPQEEMSKVGWRNEQVRELAKDRPHLLYTREELESHILKTQTKEVKTLGDTILKKIQSNDMKYPFNGVMAILRDRITELRKKGEK